MGESQNRPHESTPNDRQAVDQVLRTVTQDLRNLQQNLVSQLSQDVTRLQAERSRLMEDIEALQIQHDQLQANQEVLLNQQQLAQQKVWAKQLAQALASQLYQMLSQRLTEGGLGPDGTPALPGGHGHSSSGLLALDETLNQALVSLQQDLNSYHSSLSQQIDRMQTLEKQGEVLLETLVSRLSDRLQGELTRLPQDSQSFPPAPRTLANGVAVPTSPPPPPPAPRPIPQSSSNGKYTNGIISQDSRSTPASPAPRPVVPPPPTPTVRTPGPRRFTGAQQGLIFILLSTLALSLHNVVVRIIGSQTSIFGIFNLPSSIALNSLDDSLLLLWLRMLVVVPVMVAIAGFLYPASWRDIKGFTLSRDPRLIRNVVGSGAFLFLSQVLIYIAIASVGPGVAVTILFMYPLITVPLAWLLFGDRPTSVRWGVMAAILCGVILTALPRLVDTNLSFWGIFTAILSGFFFALYLIAMQISFRKLHPVPVSVMQFMTIFVLTSLMLAFVFPVQDPPSNLTGLILGGVVLGSLTLVGYLLNNLGVQRMGAARASIIASSGPVLTALLAFLITGDQLQSVQWGGILLVTLGILGLSFERMFLQAKPAKR